VSAAEQLSLALASLRMRETLREQSRRDAWTGLYNRRHLDLGLESEFARARAGSMPLTLLMLDVDHFKVFNDRHGHVAGIRRRPDRRGRFAYWQCSVCTTAS